MQHLKVLAGAGAFLALQLISGCGGADPSSADAGAIEDAGTIDAGPPSDAGTGQDAGPLSSDCESGAVGKASDVSGSSRIANYGSVELDTANTNAIAELKTTLVVPAIPHSTGTIFLWPGLQPLPGGHNYDPINNGVLQPVLTWGPTCAPHAPAAPYASWWISAQYVNTIGSHAGYTGCQGGTGMNVAVGDSLTLDMVVSGTTWTQTVTDTTSGQSVSYSIDMQGQAQARALFEIEDYMGGAPTADVIFNNTEITYGVQSGNACQPLTRGTNDYFAAPHASSDKTRCCISKIILRAQGVAATSPNGP